MGRLLWSCLFLSCLLHHLQAASSSSSTHHDFCHPDERSALLHFKGMFTLANITDDYVSFRCNSTSPKTAYWNKSSTDCCSWDGVTCDEFTSHVIGLDLSCSHLRGTMHPNTSLFRLSHLQRLNLAFNDFSGSTIPSGFGSQFPGLTHLNLSYANFSGLIPSEISHLSNLVSLDLSSTNDLILEPHNFNMLLKNQTQIQQLVLWRVNISSSIPDSIMNLSSLTKLDLGSTNLHGKLSNNIFHLPKIQYLYFDGNHALTGNLQERNWSFSSSSSLKELWLSRTNLSGKLPDSIGNLKSLNALGLGYCGLSGSIPRSLGNLTQIYHLGLSGNSFNNEDKGQFPDIFAKLVNLEYLGLSGYNFSGPFPGWVANLTQLTDLEMSSMALTGSIPSNISGLQNLEWLDLSNNLLHGPIPSGISGLQNLESLYLSNNLLNGSIPSFLFSIPSLRKLDLSSNPLTDPIPNLYQHNTSTSSLLWSLNLSSCNIQTFSYFTRTFQSLEELYLSNNEIHGQIPKFHNASSLSFLDLSNNKIHGQIPKWVHNASSLYFSDLSHNYLEGSLLFPPFSPSFFSVSHNKLTGEIPSSLCNLSSLKILNLSHNKLSGVIPQCLGNFSNYLAVLDLRMNAFHGIIPVTFANSNSLRNLNLNGNQLQGPVPQVLRNCRSLEVLDLGNNELNDTFPYWLESLPELQVLILHSNKFHGLIPTSRAKVPFRKLRIIDLSHNEFIGPLPSRYFQSFKAMMIVDEYKIDLKYMGQSYYQDSMELVIKGIEIELMRILTIFTTIDFSDNHFTGEIPAVIGTLYSLRLLNLSHNNLNGHIPSSLGDLPMLESLDLSSNQFTGEIPRQLAKLTFLEVMNLSRNHLVGPIPRGNQFDTFENRSYEGNLALCGLPLSKKCGDDEAPPQHQPPITFHKEDESNFLNEFNIWKATMMGYGCGIMLGLVVGCLIFLTGKPEWFIKVTEEEFFMKVRSSNKIGQRRVRRRN